MRLISGSLLLMMLLAASVAAQETSKKRIYITDSNSWEITGGFGGSDGGFGGAVNGGARPQTAEIIKTFNERCPSFTITSKQDRADFTILLQHEGGKDLLKRDNKYVVYNKDGDVIASGSTRILGNAVKDACQAITEEIQSGSSTTQRTEN